MFPEGKLSMPLLQTKFFARKIEKLEFSARLPASAAVRLGWLVGWLPPGFHQHKQHHQSSC
jgi:hypothetical protein